MRQQPEQPEQDDDWVSKSQLKREMTERQQLGEKLCKLSPSALAKVPVPESLADAIALAKKIQNKREGYRRQLQYIGKLMRNLDVEPIQLALERLENQHGIETQLLHQSEQWRDRIIAEGDSAIQAFIDLFPQADRQQLRQLMRAAQRELKNSKPPKSSREIFKLVKDLINEA